MGSVPAEEMVTVAGSGLISCPENRETPAPIAGEMVLLIAFLCFIQGTAETLPDDWATDRQRYRRFNGGQQHTFFVHKFNGKIAKRTAAGLQYALFRDSRKLAFSLTGGKTGFRQNSPGSIQSLGGQNTRGIGKVEKGLVVFQPPGGDFLPIQQEPHSAPGGINLYGCLCSLESRPVPAVNRIGKLPGAFAGEPRGHGSGGARQYRASSAAPRPPA